MNTNITKIARFIVYFLIAILIFLILYTLFTSISIEFKSIPKNRFKVDKFILYSWFFKFKNLIT